MFIAKKIIAAFLLPPGIFIVLLLWLGWRLIRKKRRGTGLVLWLLALALWASAINPVASRLQGSLERGFAVPQTLRGDVIVLLGGGLHDGVTDLTGQGAPSNEMLARIVTAVRVQRQLRVPVIVSGGVVYPGRSAEAPIVRRFLTDLGVPADQIILEDRSRDTEDNGRFTAEILRQRGYQEPLLLTSAYHLRRSVAMFRRVGVTVTPLPTNFYQGRVKAIWADWLPEAGAMAGSARALREYLGLGWYKLTFWRKA